MKVLVTGATGFIGNYVITGLLKKGHNVIATSYNEFKAKQKDWFDHVIYVQHDIHQNSSENLYRKFHCPDHMIHLAWGGLNDYKSQEHIEVIMPAHLSFIKILIGAGLKDLTCIGTCFEYGLQEGKLTEDLETQPIISYPIAKDRLRKELESLQKSSFFRLKWVRLFYMYGEGQSPRSILSLLDKTLQEKAPVFNMSLGEQIRDYLPVKAVAENIIAIALQNEIEGIINCCSNTPITIRKLVEDYLRKKNKCIRLNFGYYSYTDYEPMAFWGDNTKLKKILSNSHRMQR